MIRMIGRIAFQHTAESAYRPTQNLHYNLFSDGQGGVNDLCQIDDSTNPRNRKFPPRNRHDKPVFRPPRNRGHRHPINCSCDSSDACVILWRNPLQRPGWNFPRNFPLPVHKIAHFSQLNTQKKPFTYPLFSVTLRKSTRKLKPFHTTTWREIHPGVKPQAFKLSGR